MFTYIAETATSAFSAIFREASRLTGENGIPIEALVLALFLVSAIGLSFKGKASLIVPAFITFIVLMLTLPSCTMKEEQYMVGSNGFFIDDRHYETREVTDWGGVWFLAIAGSVLSALCAASFKSKC